MKDELYSPEEAMPAREREQYYNEKIGQVIQFAYDHAPATKDRLDKAGVKPSQIKTTRDLELIPPITRDEVIELQKANPPFGGLLAIPKERLFRVIYSPGPLYFPFSSPEYARPALKALHAAGMRKGDMVICSWPMLFGAGILINDAAILGQMVPIPAGAGNTEIQVNMIHDLGIEGYAGSPTFLINMVRKADELGYDFRREFKMRSALVSGEPVLPELRNTLERDYGINLIDGWGGFAAIWMGCECSQKNGCHVHEEVFLEVVDPDTGKQLGPGEVGAMVVTALYNNDAFQTVRYMTGDLTAYSDEPCPCGRTSIRFMGALGRLGESLKVRGLYITPGQVKTVVSKFPVISNLQVIVGRVGYRDEITINLELADETIDRDTLSEKFQTSFQDACRLRFDKINFVSPGTIPEEHKTIVDERSWQVRR